MIIRWKLLYFKTIYPFEPVLSSAHFKVLKGNLSWRLRMTFPSQVEFSFINLKHIKIQWKESSFRFL